MKLLYRVIAILCTAFFVHCGGGADIGNPGNVVTTSITGCVKNPDGSVSSGACVILGKYVELPFNTSIRDTISNNGILIVVTSRIFDTVFCDTNGKFSFDGLTPAEYVITASLKKKSLCSRISTVNGDMEALIRLEEPVTVIIRTYTKQDTSQLHFIGARITGTPFVSTIDSAGLIRFDSVPAGIPGVFLYRSDTMSVLFEYLPLSAGNTAELIVDPMRDPSYWTLKSDIHPWNSRPYVLRYGRPNDALLIPDSLEYDCFVQFSHTMDTYITSGAVKIVSNDSSIHIDKMIWQGSALALLRLSAKDSTGIFSRLNLDTTAPWTITVDTTAVSSFGFSMVWPDTMIVE